MNEQAIQAEAHKSFEHLRTGKENDDLSAVVKDIEDARGKMTPKEYDQYIKALNKETASVLPNVEIIGTAVQLDKHQLVVTDKKHDITHYLDKDESERLDLVRPLNGETIEKRGKFDVAVNERGEVTAITDKEGWTMRRAEDGNWYHISPDGKDLDGTPQKGVYQNLRMDDKGNLSYDRDGRHIEQRADGTVINASTTDSSKFVWNSQGQLAEAPAGDGHQRKFHYDEQGKLDQIDGRLGHWERSTRDGQTVWVNKDTKEEWHGDFEVDRTNGDLHFKPRRGTHWTFTREGRDVRTKEDDEQVLRTDFNWVRPSAYAR